MQTAAVQTQREPQLRRSGNNRMPRRIRIGIAPPLPALIKPPPMLNRAKETRRRSQVGIAPPLPALIKPPPMLNRAKESADGRPTMLNGTTQSIDRPPLLALIKPPPMLNRDKETRRRSPVGIAPPLPARIKPPPMLNRDKETRRRRQIETGSLLQPRISNLDKHCWIAKNCALNCCNNSTSFSPLAIPPVVSSLACRTCCLTPANPRFAR